MVAREPARHFPGLDGIRAIAALGVMVSHTLKELGRFGAAPIDRNLELARQGVVMFFTLSGFLITYLLLEEKARYGRIALGAFYLRRILRIWPLYFFYIALAMAYHQAWTPYVAMYVLFVPNLAYAMGHIVPDTAQLWSIGIEEQFYAVWPLIVARVRRLVPLLVTIVIAMPLARAIVHHALGPGRHLANDLLSLAGYDAMATGALFAIALRADHPIVIRCAKTAVPHVAFGALVALLAANQLGFLHFGLPIVTEAVTGLFIVAQIVPGKKLLNLEQPLLRFIGRISFGVYVYHMLVITLLARALAGTHLPAVAIVLAVTATTLAVAALSYRFLERPFLRLKDSLRRDQ
jgi:peptidoglycan/LPS O-acetylase OafA/YrhL